jgi:hypothetical protein
MGERGENALIWRAVHTISCTELGRREETSDQLISSACKVTDFLPSYRNLRNVCMYICMYVRVCMWICVCVCVYVDVDWGRGHGPTATLHLSL